MANAPEESEKHQPEAGDVKPAGSANRAIRQGVSYLGVRINNVG